ncbi:hypothetical protein RI367_001698 [Sorochytrium milnesiophthora]
MPAASSFWTVGCILGASAVGFGAFGAHGLRKVIVDAARLKNWETAAHYQLLHSLVLLLSTLPPMLTRSGAHVRTSLDSTAPASLSSYLFTGGMACFSGSIYCLVYSPARFRWMGPVTPLGGLMLIGGWASLAGEMWKALAVDAGAAAYTRR